MAKQDVQGKLVADNRKARYNYEILDTLEAGLALKGSEVKAMRSGKASIAESYASVEGDELYLINAHIPEYTEANRQQHGERRPRKLLLHRSQINKLIGAVQREGMTLIPLRLYFNARGIAKLQLALARGKKLHDKRETERQRDWQRDKARLLRERG